VLILTLPVPGYLIKLRASAQKAQMKKVGGESFRSSAQHLTPFIFQADERLQTVTQSTHSSNLLAAVFLKYRFYSDERHSHGETVWMGEADGR
jgi:hypothetical protein